MEFRWPTETTEDYLSVFRFLIMEFGDCGGCCGHMSPPIGSVVQVDIPILACETKFKIFCSYGGADFVVEEEQNTIPAGQYEILWLGLMGEACHEEEHSKPHWIKIRNIQSRVEILRKVSNDKLHIDWRGCKRISSDSKK